MCINQIIYVVAGKSRIYLQDIIGDFKGNCDEL